MKNKILSIALLCALILSISGCNSKKEPSDVSSQKYDYDYYNYDTGSEYLPSEDVSASSQIGSNAQTSSTVSNTGTEYDPSTYNKNTDWFKAAKYGIFVHYVNQIQNDSSSLNGLSQGKQTSWDECVKEFDTDKFAKAANDTGAAYVMFTILQVSRYMIAPNATYDKYTGYKPGEACATRDLIADLIKSLDKYNIKLFLYYTGDGPSNDTKAAAGLGVDGTANRTMLTRWLEVAKEYSLRYGNKIYGWWVDGAHLSGYNDTTMKEFAQALKAGNPNSIVAFNPGGADNDVHYYTSADDYTAGERNSFLGQIPKSRFINPTWPSNRIQWHILSFLGDNWAFPNVKYSLRDFTKYIGDCTKNGGVVTIDVGVYRDGSISERQVNFLADVKAQIRK